MLKNEKPNPYLFLPGTSVMHDLIRAKDWSKTPVGAPETWPSGFAYHCKHPAELAVPHVCVVGRSAYHHL
jgi:hypothetical protein